MKFFFLLCTFGFVVQASAQYGNADQAFVELGVKGGVTNYQGDLANGFFKPGATSYMLGAFFTYHVNSNFAIKLSLEQGQLQGDDAKSGDAFRNLSFKSPVTEFAVQPEWYFTGFIPENLERPFAPYLFAGIGVFHFNPQAQLNGQWVELQPLGTEGQNINSPQYAAPYSLTQFDIPLGIGFKFAVSREINIGVEAAYRFTFTDYLDDVSTSYVNPIDLQGSGRFGDRAVALSNRTGQTFDFTHPNSIPARGNPSTKDAFFTAGITVSYNFLDGFLGMGQGKRGCPTF